MASKIDCESSLFNLFLIKDNLIHNKVDPDFNFFQDIPSFGTKYHYPPEVKQSFKNFSDNAVSIFRVNIISTKKNFENFKYFYYALDFRFSMICLSETWTNDSFGKNSDQLKTLGTQMGYSIGVPIWVLQKNLKPIKIIDNVVKVYNN